MKILLVCSGGMSSAIVAKALQDAGTKEGLDIQVDECGTQAFAEKVKEDYNISLVAPQIRHRYDVLKASADEAGVPYTAGFVHQVMYETYLKDHDAPEDIEYYMCGPGPMSKAVQDMLYSIGVEPESIMFDNFG